MYKPATPSKWVMMWVEEHVPAEDVKRMLEERPDVIGIGVGGMTIGSPGMEGPDPEP